MNIVLLFLEIISGALVVLKQIPATSVIANEISSFEVALQDVITAAQAADAQAKLAVVPADLQPIVPQS